MTSPACPTHTQSNWPTCTSGDPDCQLKKNLVIYKICLKIKNAAFFRNILGIHFKAFRFQSKKAENTFRIDDQTNPGIGTA